MLASCKLHKFLPAVFMVKRSPVKNPVIKVITTKKPAYFPIFKLFDDICM